MRDRRRSHHCRTVHEEKESIAALWPTEAEVSLDPMVDESRKILCHTFDSECTVASGKLVVRVDSLASHIRDYFEHVGRARKIS